ncbi:MAG: hypothetical protein LBS84_00340 [Clostridiales bacterium]|nr:hypothetical protein [Clostridiales bacterium]
MKRILASITAAFILTTEFGGFSAPSVYLANDSRRIYQAGVDAEIGQTGYIFEVPVYENADTPDNGGVYAEIGYISARDRIMADIYANSALSEYIAQQFVSHAEEFSLKDFPEAADISILLDALTEAYYQNNAYIGGIELNQIMCDFNTLTLRIPYVLSADEQRLLQEDIMAEAGLIVNRIITPGMSDYQKAEAINTYLCESAAFDLDAKADLLNLPRGRMISDTYKHSQTAYGVLINRRGICQSFAEAFKVLAGRAGLTSIVVTGVLIGYGSHAWNRANADGRWFTLDVTNNAMSGDVNKFFNLSDEAAAEYFTEDDQYALDSEKNRF